MTETRIKIGSIIENQLPEFVKIEFPLVSEFLIQYYTSLESQGGSSDILQNIDKYVKVDNLTNLVESTKLTSDVTFFDSTINVVSTYGFPDSYGLLLIDSEVITYTSKTSTSFEGCVRGFSGITSYGQKDQLTFTESQSEEHINAKDEDGIIISETSKEVINLSILFLKEFLIKIKKQVTPGFENRELYSELNEGLFIKQSIDFYSSKGTDSSFKILFGALYGENVDIIKPRDYLIQPSDAQYRITSDLIVEPVSVEDNPEELVNGTLYQDKTEFTEQAKGTITKVEKIVRNLKDYYIISLDSDYDKDILPAGTVYGRFNINPKTKIVDLVTSNSQTLEVDSTVGFPNKNGTLIIQLENDVILTVTYTNKTLNQFLGCSGIIQDIPEGTEVKLDSFIYGYSGIGTSNIVRMRILGILFDLKVPDNTSLYSKNESIKIKTLGIESSNEKFNNWFFNVSTKYDVRSIQLLDSSNKTYRINTFNDNSFRIGDSVSIIDSSGNKRIGLVSLFNNFKSFNVKLGPEFSLLNVNSSYIVEKNASKVSSSNYPQVNQYLSNVQNVYYEDENNLYVASPSLPSYSDVITGNTKNLTINDRSVTINGVFIPDDESNLLNGTTLTIEKHGFYTGDSVVYKASAIDKETQISDFVTSSPRIYFVKKIDQNKIKLTRSRDNLFTNNYVSINATLSDSKLELTEFNYRDLSTQLLESQKLIRKISNPENDSNLYDTKPGSTGIFINGVELLNYKSNDNIYYGEIENIFPTSPGQNYDVINPPTLVINDPSGSGASGYCSVVGDLERVEIIDPGFDYLEEPIITITGGNGIGCLAKANLISFDHLVSFNSDVSNGLVKLNPINTVGFSTYHKFRDYEEVIYQPNGQTSISGLSTNSSYFVSVQDDYTIKLHTSVSDAVSGINTVQLTNYGSGNHVLRSKNKKKKIGSINVENTGRNYQNKLTTSGISGINTSSNTIFIRNHGYESGEIITYDSTQTSVGGLSSASSYYVTKINDSEFKLSQIAPSQSGLTSSFYYETKQYINLISTGSGTHKFNYPKIKVFVEGKIGVSTFSNQNYGAVIRPIFRGQIQSVFLENSGSKYGSEEIINYNRQPTIETTSGSGAEVKPIILNGAITEILIINPGSNYNSIPDININGSGVGAILTPIFSNGSLSEVRIINGGFGYDDKTTIDIIPAGNGVKFESKIKPWKINLVERLLLNSQITDDDSIISVGLNNNYGLQYTHAYAPRLLRSLVQGTSFRDGIKTYSVDFQRNSGGIEIDSTSHSPIIGWAYDGNPIYGPYGYSKPTGEDGQIKSLSSGYKIIDSVNPNRPSRSIYPLGFFIEDYTFTDDGDLDEHNGRFCVTPEYPNGVYAYFTTLSNKIVDKNKVPSFPYVIGNNYKSIPIDFNFRPSSNQDEIDINETGWRRNTYPYNILSEGSSYDYLIGLDNIKSHDSVTKNTSFGSLDSIEVVDGGENYKVGDRIVFSQLNSLDKAKSKVSLIKGKTVSQISVASSTTDNVRLYPFNSEFIGFASSPHGYSNNDLVTFTGKYDYKKSANISIIPNQLVLTSGIGSTSYTGLVTYFNVSGNLNYPNIKENDIYQIESEQVKILNIDPVSSRIRVLRNQNSTLGLSSYNSGTLLTEKTRKFKINFGISTTYNSDIEKEFYFNPSESVGLGTTSGVGIVTTLYFSNPGVGITQITIPTQTIYLPNHNLKTGDSLIYSANDDTQISVSTDGSSSFQLNESSIVYVAKISNDLVGISTVKVGLSSTGTFVGVGSDSNSILYFTSIGTGDNHSFKTNYSNTLSGQISKNVVTVSTAETHGLSLLDNVIISVNSGVSTEIIVKYDDYNKVTLINPRNFSTIDTQNSIIEITNHGYFTGQKILYTSSSPATGLSNNNLYYVVVIDPNRIKLSNTYFDSVKESPNTILILSSSSGTISPVNPPINLIRNQSVIFNLSDASLSFVGLDTSYPLFDFKLYFNESFTDEFVSTQSSNTFEVIKSGTIGIDSTAKVTLLVSENVPKNLWYNLKPLNKTSTLFNKKDIFVDNDVIGRNKISVKESVYNGNKVITGISSNTFSYNILETPESPSYTNNIEYYTDSKTSKGAIKEVKILKGGKYDTLPIISSVSSENGSGAILNPKTNTIGNVSSVEILNFGFDYSVDYSVRPLLKLPDILFLEPLSSFKEIKILSNGVNYNSDPDLIVIDSLTNEVIVDVELRYSLGDPLVDIIKNSSSISNVVPKIIPINNSNGIKIENITFNNSTKEVTVSLGASFSDAEDFPFKVGSKVLVEGVSVGLNTIGKGYNSENYNYELFTLTNIDANIGGSISSVTYNLTSYLESEESPGNFSSVNSSGRLVPESYFPTFEISLVENNFFNGEDVYSNTGLGKVESWDSSNRILKVSTSGNFIINEIIRGKTSGSNGIIKNIVSFDIDSEINAYSKKISGWNRETGFLNNDLQRIHDSDYYQYFSYSLKSQKDFSTWDEPVSALNHTSGFKKFSNLLIESSKISAGIGSTEQTEGDVELIADLSRVIDLNCVNDFDLVRENNLLIGNSIKSDQILFNSVVIQDYVESIGNRVLIIDDISSEFNSNPRSTEFSIINSFNLNSFRSKKYIILVKDKLRIFDNQLSLVSLIHNDSNGFLNQYGNYTFNELGFFDFNISGSEGNLLFYPINPEYNDYFLEVFSFNLSSSSSDIGETTLGDVVKVSTGISTIPVSTSSSVNILGVNSSYRASKILVQISSSDDSYFEYDELTYIHDGSNVYITEYGQITTNSLSQASSSGIGTYNAYIDGSEVKIDLIPTNTTTKEYLVNTMTISISDSSSSGIGTQIIGGSSMVSSSVAISSSPSPTSNIISSFSNEDYNGTYSIICIEDKTNSQYQLSELITIEYSDECYTTEYGVLNSNSNIGIITAGVSSSFTNIYFTPIENIDVDVKVFQIQLGLESDSADINLQSGSLHYNYATYLGRFNDIKKSFELTHGGLPIFERTFDGGNPNIVDVSNNVIKIANHFYSTGEEIEYVCDPLNAIGISSTNVPGIGITDKLPSSLFVVKINEVDISVASSASHALSGTNLLNITSVGIGSTHTFKSKNQNKKGIISIDNIIQSPIVSTAITTTLSEYVEFFDEQIFVSSIDSIFGGDYIRIDDEIMKVTSVGVGSTNLVTVLRPWFGTGISTHSSSSLVQKIKGNYNIVENTIHFADAPFGQVPIQGIIGNRPDEVDYAGISTSSSFSGRIFLRSGLPGTDQEAYAKNYILDDISDQFNGIDRTFTTKSNFQDVSGISTDNAIVLINNIFQGPDSLGEYNLTENVGITSITFEGNPLSVDYDINTSSIPRGGIILSVGSTGGFGYQPLVSAGGTAIVSAAGTIQSISIGNSGSGYRSGIQTAVNVGVVTSSLETVNVHYVGIASISDGSIVSVAITNPGFGYTNTNPPIVVFDDPLSYSNIPLVYSSESQPGFGTESTVDIIVGQGSSIISFELKNLGYAYKPGDILTISVGGTTGIPTNTSLPFSEFKIFVDKIHVDSFSGWSIGNLQILDSLDSLFDGVRKTFQILVNGNQTTIRSRKGSNIDVTANLLIFINDVLQVPGKSYRTFGGSNIIFDEAPKEGDKSKIIFYRGTGGVDVQFLDALETIKEGDRVTIKSDNINLSQNSRIVEEIISSDVLRTNLYNGPGISQNETLLRPLIWCRQTEDLFINGNPITKDRIIYEPYIQPTSNIIEDVSIGSTVIYVESVRTFFDSEKEYTHDGTTEIPQNKIIIVSQDSVVSASATAIVSSNGTISSIIISNPGFGYDLSNPPSVTIESPTNFGTSQRAIANAVVSSSSTISNISLSYSGIGYTNIDPPVVLIEPPKPSREIISDVSYEGDFGVVVGYGITIISNRNNTIFDLYIPQNSYLQDSSIVGTAITLSQLETGDFFVIKNSNVGFASTSIFTLRSDDSIIGVTTEYMNGIYQVSSTEIKYVNIVGIGSTYIKRVFANITSGISTIKMDSTNIFFDSTYYKWDNIGISTSSEVGITTFKYFGEFTWGKIFASDRPQPRSFNSYGFSGIDTSSSVIRFNALKYKNYN